MALNPNQTPFPSNQHISAEELNHYNHLVNQLKTQVNKLKRQVKNVENFYQSTDVQQNDSKNKGKEKAAPSRSKKPLQRASEDMQEEIMRNFNKILNEITQDKWAWPFLKPVDVEGLGLDDYYQIIEKPMDFSTIKTRMEAKDGSGYKNVREIYADVRLIFNNAMKYNDESSDVHLMAKTLLDKIEKKWLHLLPKVFKAESELSKEEANEQLNKKLAQEATYANKTMELSTELSEVDMALRSLKTTAMARCRKLSRPEKTILANAFPKLSLVDRLRAINIIKVIDPNFEDDNIDTVTLDIDSQSDYALLRLYVFVKNTLEVQEGTSAVNDEDNNEEMENNAKKMRIE